MLDAPLKMNQICKTAFTPWLYLSFRLRRTKLQRFCFILLLSEPWKSIWNALGAKFINHKNVPSSLNEKLR